MTKPLLKVEYSGGVDLLHTTGTMDFDGGSLLVWRDESRRHLVAAYSPSSAWVVSWQEEENE